MQPVKEIAEQVSRQMTQAGSTHSTRTEHSDREWTARAVNHVIQQLKAIFPAWTAAIKTPEQEAEVRRQWLQGLIENRIDSDLKIKAGLARCRSHNSPFLPSIGQFVAWCNEGAELACGLPEEDLAFRQFSSVLSTPLDFRDWTRLHPAIYWAYSQVSSWDWGHMKLTEMRKEFSSVWREARKMARQGFNFNACLPKPDEVKAEETPEPCDPKEVEAAKREILSFIGKDMP